MNDNLFDNIDLEDISPCLVLNKADILRRINTKFGTESKNLDEANQIVEQEKYKRLGHLIDTKFTDDVLQQLLENFQNREDDIVQSTVTDNDEPPDHVMFPLSAEDGFARVVSC